MGTSLVLREQTATSPRRYVLRRASDLNGHCPKFGFDFLDTETGALRPASCKSVRCDTCGPFEVKRRAWRAARAQPQAFITLTALPGDYKAARLAEARLLRRLRARFGTVEWCIAHELTKRGQRHAHALAKVPFIPQRELSTMCEKAGMGRVVYISAIRNVGATNYALKEALRVVNYATKGVESLSQHLALNGGHVYRATRGYW